MIDLLNTRILSTWIIYLIFFIIIIMIIDNYRYREDFIFIPWNISTRYYPSYDIRGDPIHSNPLIYPYNYPILYLSPYTYKK